MFIRLIVLLTLATLAADVIYCICLRRTTRRTASAYGPSPRHATRRTARRRVFVWFAVVTDALPFVIVAVNLFGSDNTTVFMHFVMWTLWLWMATVLPRMLYYLFSLVRLPRVGLVAGVALALSLVWGATVGRTHIRVNQIEVRSAQIPAGFDGFRIAQFSDVHLGTMPCFEKELGRLVDRIQEREPDLVVFTGDLVNIRHTELNERAMRILGGLRAPFGVVSVTGNHDTGTYIDNGTDSLELATIAQVIARERAMGWNVLDDTTTLLHRGGDSISLSGISFDRSLGHGRHERALPVENIEAVYGTTPDSLYNITAVHIPQLWPQVTAAGYGDLTLAGHVHAMQMKFSLFGRVFSPAQWLYTRWSGRYDEGASTLYINDGIGCVGYPMRLGAYPEITLITLRRCE